MMAELVLSPLIVLRFLRLDSLLSAFLYCSFAPTALCRRFPSMPRHFKILLSDGRHRLSFLGSHFSSFRQHRLALLISPAQLSVA